MDNHFSAHINSILLCTALDYEFMIVASELCAVTPVEYMYLELSTTSLVFVTISHCMIFVGT